MTVQEAKNILNSSTPKGNNAMCIFLQEAVEMAIQALEEVEQYRSLGTVEELKEAREKQIPKKPIQISPKRHPYFVCPKCMEQISTNQPYCDECGKALKWGEEDD